MKSNLCSLFISHNRNYGNLPAHKVAQRDTGAFVFGTILSSASGRNMIPDQQIKGPYWREYRASPSDISCKNQKNIPAPVVFILSSSSAAIFQIKFGFEKFELSFL
jgi:hypothetical protein